MDFKTVFGQVSFAAVHHGKWSTSMNYDDYLTNYLIVDRDSTHESLCGVVRSKVPIDLDPTKHSLKLTVGVNYGQPISQVFDVVGEKDLAMFMDLVCSPNSLGSFALIVESIKQSDVLDDDDVVDNFEDMHGGVDDYSSHRVIVEDVPLDKIPDGYDVNVENMFHSKHELTSFMKKLAIKNGYRFKVSRSCSKRITMDCRSDGCKWHLRASSGGIMWVIRKYTSKHSCILISNDHPQATSLIISDCIQSGLVSDNVAPKNIRKFMQLCHGVSISYFKAWSAKQNAIKTIRGSPRSSYSLLPSLGQLIEERNPGSKTALLLEEDGIFRYFYVAFSASIEGWRHCRPVITVDGAHLRSKYMGTVLIASAADGDNQVFPIALAIVDVESDMSWEWFFEKLKDSIGERNELVIISDRMPSIPKAIHNVFEDAHHGICMKHLLSNLQNKYRKKCIESLFVLCAKSYWRTEFDFYMREMESHYPSIREYLSNADYTKWARCFFARRRYNLMTSNNSECMNVLLKDARSWPVCAFIEFFRATLQRWFYDGKVTSLARTSSLIEWAEKKMIKRKKYADVLTVNPVSFFQFGVIDKNAEEFVDLNKRTCTCCRWEINDIPCSHAIASLMKRGSDPYNYVSRFYSQEACINTYAGVVILLGDISSLESNERIIAPSGKPGPGRPKKNRYMSYTERRISTICGHCGCSGHNIRTCKNEIPPLLRGVSTGASSSQA